MKSAYAYDEKKSKSTMLGDELREKIARFSKEFKTSWLDLGQALFAVWQDKHFKAWGYDRFEVYIEKEVGLKKDVAVKLLKSYYFIEQDEPQYLKKEFIDDREAMQVPGYESLNVLRLAKSKKELDHYSYQNLKKSVFEKGKDASAVKKDLTAILRERKEVDPDEERENRNRQSIQRLMSALRMFSKDAQTLKLLPADIIEETNQFIKKLESHIQ